MAVEDENDLDAGDDAALAVDKADTVEHDRLLDE